MLSYFVRRLVAMLATVAAVSLTAFLVVQLPPGDYVTTYVSQQELQGQRFSDAEVEALRAELGLDRPVVVQYAAWVGNALRGDLGRSLKYQRPVSDLIGERLPMTLLLFVATILVTYTVGIGIGVYSAVRQYSLGDYIFTTLGFIGVATPRFLLALVIMYLGLVFFGMDAGGLQSFEYYDVAWRGSGGWGKFLDLLKHLVVPVLVIGLSGTAGMIRVMRGTLLDEIRSQYVTTARAKGVPELKLLFKYPVRVACNPIISSLASMLPLAISGQVIVAIVLNLPTVSPLLLTSLQAQDTYLAGGIILILTCLVVIGAFISDLLLVVVDPRIRLEKQGG